MSLKGPIEEKINSNFYKNNEKKLDDDLNEIVNNYKKLGIDSPEKEKILNEQFFKLFEMLKSFTINNLKIMEENNGEICILECRNSYSKEFMKNFKDFPLPEDEFNNLANELKNSEINKLEKQVTNKGVLLILKNKLVDLLDKETEDIRKYNSASSQTLDYQIFLSYCRTGMKQETRLFKERLEKEEFKVWHDDKCLPNFMGEDYKEELIKGINSSKLFLFIWNKNYSKSDNCRKEFKWAVSKKKKIICIELERNSNENDPILFDLIDQFALKLYHGKENCKLSEITEKEFKHLVESLKNQLK